MRTMNAAAEMGPSVERARLGKQTGAKVGPHPGQPKSVGDWLKEIKEYHSRKKINIIELGKLVLAAKRMLLRGQWTAMWRVENSPPPNRRPFASAKRNACR